MAPASRHGIDDVRAVVGTHLGPSNWLASNQERVDLFADATGDHRCIHVDVERAAAGQLGAMIAHGYPTVSLVPVPVAQVVQFRGLIMAMNDGSNKVRFTSPVDVGSRVRAGVEVTSLTETAPGTHLAGVTVIVEIDGGQRLACVAETHVLLVAGADS